MHTSEELSFQHDLVLHRGQPLPLQTQLHALESVSEHAQEIPVYGPESKTKAKLALKTSTTMTSSLLFPNEVSLLHGPQREETQFKD